MGPFSSFPVAIICTNQNALLVALKLSPLYKEERESRQKYF